MTTQEQKAAAEYARLASWLEAVRGEQADELAKGNDGYVDWLMRLEQSLALKVAAARKAWEQAC